MGHKQEYLIYVIKFVSSYSVIVYSLLKTFSSFWSTAPMFTESLELRHN